MNENDKAISISPATNTAPETAWFHDENGRRQGPHSVSTVVDLIKSGAIARGTLVWRQGLNEWKPIEETEMRQHLDSTAPPPLTGDQINNTATWVLAFAPFLGTVLEYAIAGAIYNGNEYRAIAAVGRGDFWYITIVLNIVLSLWDEHRLKLAGVNASKFKGWIWLIPVYLFQRANALKQNLSYFVVWIICFLIWLSRLA